MTFLRSLLLDGEDGTWSSKRVITFLAFIFCSIAFFANLFFEKKMDPLMFEGMMYIAIAGLGVTVTERFANRSIPTQPHQHRPINNRHNYGTPLPKTEEREI